MICRINLTSKDKYDKKLLNTHIHFLNSQYFFHANFIVASRLLSARCCNKCAESRLVGGGVRGELEDQVVALRHQVESRRNLCSTELGFRVLLYRRNLEVIFSTLAIILNVERVKDKAHCSGCGVNPPGALLIRWVFVGVVWRLDEG